MVLQTLTIQPDTLVSLCAVCISDNSGGKIGNVATSLLFLEQIIICVVKSCTFWLDLTRRILVS